MRAKLDTPGSFKGLSIPICSRILDVVLNSVIKIQNSFLIFFFQFFSLKILPIGAEVVLTVVEVVVPVVVMVVVLVVVVDVRLNIALLGLSKVRLNRFEILNFCSNSTSGSSVMIFSVVSSSFSMIFGFGFLERFLSKAGILMSGNLAIGRKNGGRAFLGLLVLDNVVWGSVVVVASVVSSVVVVKIGIFGNLGRI